jgi:hypothetical protein
MMRITSALFCCYLFATCTAPSIPVGARLEVLQRDCDEGRFRLAMIGIAELKDSTTDPASNRQIALKQLEIQNMYCLCYNRGFDTAKNDVIALIAHRDDAGVAAASGFYFYLASLLRNETTIDSAIRLFRVSNALYTARGEKGGQALTCFYEALCYQNNPDTTRNDAFLAERLIRETLRLSIAAADKKVQSYAYRHLAGIFADRHQVDSALIYALDSYRLREECGWWALRPFSLALIGDIYQSRDADSAKKYHLEALRYADTLGYPISLAIRRSVMIDDSLKLRQKNAGL